MPHVPDTVPGKRVTDAGARTEGRGQPSNIRGGSRMQESCTYGSVRGAPSNGCPYRNHSVRSTSSGLRVSILPAALSPRGRSRKLRACIAVAPEGHLYLPPRPQSAATGAPARGALSLGTNLTEDDPAKLWNLYLPLVRVEEAFKNLKGTSPSGRSSIKTRPGSKRISSSPSWSIACTPLWRGGCMR